MVAERESMNGHDLDDTQPADSTRVEAADLAWLRGRMMANEALMAEQHKQTKEALAEIKDAVKSIKEQAPSIAEKRALMVALATVLLGVLAKFVGVEIPQLP